VDIVGSITSQNLFDVLFIVVLLGAFVLGFIQGTIRRLLGIASMLFSFLLAASLRDILGQFFAQNWTQFPRQYSYLVAFLGMFLVFTLAFSLVIQGFYRKTPLLASSTIVDEVLGGLLGIVQAILLVGFIIVILDSYFRLPGIVADPDELPFIRPFFQAYDTSSTASLFRTTLIPAFFALTGFLIPDDIRSLFPRLGGG